jgi:hypothetical protein
LQAEQAKAYAIDRPGEIFDRSERFFFGAEQNVSCHERGLGSRTARLDFQQDKTESAAVEAWQTYRMDRDAKPRVARPGSKKIPDGIARNGKCQASGDHGIDADHASAGVGKRSARITGSEPHTSLNPGLKAEAAHWAYRVNYAGSERTHKTHWVPNGNGRLAGPKLRRISGARGRQRVGMNSERCKIAPRIARGHRCVELSPVPELYASVRTAGHV